MVPFDFRDESVAALKLALKIGRIMSFRIEVVQFVPGSASYFVADPGIMVGYGAAVSQVVRDRPNLPGIDAFLEVMAELKALERDVHFRQVEGVPGVSPIEALSDYAEDSRPALVVVHKNLYKDSEFIPGPIMHRLVRHNHFPVLVLEGESLSSSFRNVLIPSDGEVFSEAEKDFISKWVSAFDSTVHLLYADDEEVEDQKAVRMKMEHLALELGFEKFLVDSVKGRKADAIIDYGKKVGADLILMKSTEKSGLQKFLFGDLTEDIVKKKSPPVLAVHI